MRRTAIFAAAILLGMAGGASAQGVSIGFSTKSGTQNLNMEQDLHLLAGTTRTALTPAQARRASRQAQYQRRASGLGRQVGRPYQP